MTIQKIYVVSILLLVLGFQCNTNEIPKLVLEKLKVKPNPEYHYNRIIVFQNATSSAAFRFNRHYRFSSEFIYETTEQKVLDDFEKMTNDAQKTSYCWPSSSFYTISFYDKTNYYLSYLVDTVKFKDKVRIYEQSYQFSYIVKKKKWLKFLNKLNKISVKEYFIPDIKNARKIYNYTIRNNLPIVNNHKISKEWMNFDGDFKLKITKENEIIKETDVYVDLFFEYPNDSFKIETVGHVQNVFPSVGKKFNDEIILQIFCNKDFYDKFKGSKSLYTKAIANFHVIASKDELVKIDNIARLE